MIRTYIEQSNSLYSIGEPHEFEGFKKDMLVEIILKFYCRSTNRPSGYEYLYFSVYANDSFVDGVDTLNRSRRHII
jgi:hypothetical protein